MGLFDKFLNSMQLGGDDDYYDDEDDYFDDEDDDFEDEKPRRGLFGRKSSRYEDDDEDEDDYDDEPAPRSRRRQQEEKPAPTAASGNSKVTPMRSPRRSGNNMEVCVIKPRSMEDTHEITETLQENCTVVLNMEGIDMDLAQRIIDFSSGSCYALHGGLLKISNYIFIITPKGVDISGDFQEVLTGAIGVPAYEARF